MGKGYFVPINLCLFKNILDIQLLKIVMYTTQMSIEEKIPQKKVDVD